MAREEEIMKGLKDIKIGTKMLGSFIFMALLVAVVGVLSYLQLGKVMKASDSILDKDVPIADMAMEIKTDIVSMQDILAEYMLETDQGKLDTMQKEYEELAGNFQKTTAAVLAGGEIDGQKIIATTNKELIKAIEDSKMAQAELDTHARELMTQHKSSVAAGVAELSEAEKKAREAMAGVDKAGEVLHKNMEDAEKYSKEEMQAAMKAADSAHALANSLIVAVTVLSFILAVVIGYLIAQSITVPIRNAVDVSGRLSEGDLTLDITVSSQDETGQLMRAMKNMVEKLREIVADVKTASVNVASGSQQLSSSSEEMSQGASEQASSVEEVSSSMEQMVSNIRQNADNAQQTEKIALKSAIDAKVSSRAVSETVSAMKEIAGKISIIEEIARQTNLLALNAAIEAARAGEHGKGFAVVASEVRKLAERSQAAAGEISHLSGSSVEIAEQAGEMLAKLVPDIQKTAELVQEINGASSEQNSGAEQINKAIQQFDRVVQQNAASSEDMSTTAGELSSQAEHLQHAVEFFKIEGNGRGPVKNAEVSEMYTPQSGMTEGPGLSRMAFRHVKAITAKVVSFFKRSDASMDMGNGGRDADDDEFERF